MFKKIIYYCFAVYFVGSIICGSVLYRGLVIYRAQSEYYRIELERTSNQQLLLTTTIDRCWESTERTKELLSGSIDSIGELRKQLKEIRANYENMEVFLLDCYDNMHSRNSNISGAEGEIGEIVEWFVKDILDWNNVSRYIRIEFYKYNYIGE